MSIKRMLIDASHPEETRVVVVDGTRVEDYDVEVASRRQLKGNIYLAKITRVEPSLQAAFVDYGGNRHGFLAFNEIHPDYYQIPVADRERLLAEQAAVESIDRDDDTSAVDDEEELERRRARLTRYYKIQEVIKRRQIMLVQVAKEERGNKGAALTTYLSLAGRYCVLMPNTARGGGISRKIVAATDRKRLKKILAELEVPEGMAVIVRTAGAGRSKTEIKRDYEYLMRLWSSIRETTLESTAPALVYEEASLIKRSIRDLYGRDIEEIIVQGEGEYRIAKEFMKLFISSHAKRVKPYEDAEKPLFQQFGVEEQLTSMHHPTVQLRSGGYIVINPTEALVAIDVNSGRSTRERNIEETALRTNLEAADEIARQLRLRDLAGLVVLDFIDMESQRNQGMVERRLKEAMKNDRARVQLGRISPFGLLELSRQRLRPSLLETSFEVCPACSGMGLRRTTESTALVILRKLEEEGIRRRSSEVSIAVPPAVAMYLLNQKRRSLLAIEERYGMAVSVVSDDTLVPPEHQIERLRELDRVEDETVAEMEEEAEEASEDAVSEREEAAKRSRRRRSRRRRREEDVQQSVAASEDGAEQEQEQEEAADGEDVTEAADASEEIDEQAAAAEAGEGGEGAERSPRKRRRRGKRGGRRRARPETESALEGVAGEMAMDGIPAEEDGLSADEDIDEGIDGETEEEFEEAAEAGPHEVEVADAEAVTAGPVDVYLEDANPEEADEDGEYTTVEEVAVEQMTIEEVGGAIAELDDTDFAEPAGDVVDQPSVVADSEDVVSEDAGEWQPGADLVGAGDEVPAPLRQPRAPRRRRKSPEAEIPSVEDAVMAEPDATESGTVLEPEFDAGAADGVAEPVDADGVAGPVDADGVAGPVDWDDELAIPAAGEPVAAVHDEPADSVQNIEPAQDEVVELPVETQPWPQHEQIWSSGEVSSAARGEYGETETIDPPRDDLQPLPASMLSETHQDIKTSYPEAEKAVHSASADGDDGVNGEWEEAAQARILEAERAEEARRTAVVRVGEESHDGEEEPRRGWWQKLVT